MCGDVCWLFVFGRCGSVYLRNLARNDTHSSELTGFKHGYGASKCHLLQGDLAEYIRRRSNEVTRLLQWGLQEQR
ncbi:hypothetical protein JTE90_020367 [Oedothorax gibbosus]|uniref:Secreted protein n=1 Tax=Oedothorax gibbosus TaxID=931172 RepID=A0AAV6TXY5_9ARAC|nr:hypothetical protein JTE90_020367 [Oedothorax gibbosus]